MLDFAAADDPWKLEEFKGKLSITIREFGAELVEFEMRGIDPPLANAFRRILIAEVPVVAISQAVIYQNTSVIHDENLAHRLGLVPIVYDPDKLAWRVEETNFDETNSFEFQLNKVGPQMDKNKPQKGSTRTTVYSGDLIWQPRSVEEKTKYQDNPPRPVADDIIIAKLGPGQEIDVLCKCEKGMGKEHAKYSPVCNATYRLVPVITLSKPVVGADAVKLQKACPDGVILIDKGSDGQKRAVVGDPCKLNVHRECLEPFEPLGVTVETAKDHYLFHIESTGSVSAETLFTKAIARLKEKCAVARGLVTDSAGR